MGKPDRVSTILHRDLCGPRQRVEVSLCGLPKRGRGVSHPLHNCALSYREADVLSGVRSRTVQLQEFREDLGSCTSYEG